MASLKSYDYPGWGDVARENFYYAQAIRVGDRIVCSGQGGWNPKTSTVAEMEGFISKNLDEEIDQAFANVDINLKHAGGKGWSQVFRICTYHIDIPSSHERVMHNMKKWMPDHRPIWTELGVRQLGVNSMHIEIDVEAYDPEGAAAAQKA